MTKANLGKSFEDFKALHLLPITPGLLLSIKIRLADIPGEDVLSMAIKTGAQRDEITEVFKMILAGYKKNARVFIKVLGKDLLKDVIRYFEELKNNKANQLHQQTQDDIPSGLFQVSGLYGYMGDN